MLECIFDAIEWLFELVEYICAHFSVFKGI